MGVDTTEITFLNPVKSKSGPPNSYYDALKLQKMNRLRPTFVLNLVG